MSSATTKSLEDHSRQLVNDHRILSLVKKNHFTTSRQVRQARLDLRTKVFLKKSCLVLEQDSLHRWNWDERIAEWWKEKCMGKKGRAYDPKQTASSVKHRGGSVISWACIAVNGTGSLLFINNVIANGWILKYSVKFSQILQKKKTEKWWK